MHKEYRKIKVSNDLNSASNSINNYSSNNYMFNILKNNYWVKKVDAIANLRSQNLQNL